VVSRYLTLIMVTLVLTGLYPHVGTVYGDGQILDSTYRIEYSVSDVLDILLGSIDSGVVPTEFYLADDHILMASPQYVVSVSLESVVLWSTEVLTPVVEDLRTRYGFGQEARLEYRVGGLSPVGGEAKLVYLVKVWDGLERKMYVAIASLDSSTGEYRGLDWAVDAEELGLRYADLDIPVSLWHVEGMGRRVFLGVDGAVFLVDLETGEYRGVAEDIMDASIGPYGYIALYTRGEPAVYVFKAGIGW